MRVVSIHRFPVKCMQGETLASAALGERGVQGDREWGVADAESGVVLSIKRAGPLLSCRARTLDGTVLVAVPGGGEMEASDPRLAATLSSLLGRSVEMVQARPEATETIEYAQDSLTGEGGPRLSERPGWFFDGEPLHALSLDALATLRRAHPGGAWDHRRFRPNLVLDAGGRDGYPEDDLLGATWRVGTAVVEFARPTLRCVVTTYAQQDLAADPEILRTVTAEHDRSVGVYGTVREAGTVQPGETIVAG